MTTDQKLIEIDERLLELVGSIERLRVMIELQMALICPKRNTCPEPWAMRLLPARNCGPDCDGAIMSKAKVKKFKPKDPPPRRLYLPRLREARIRPFIYWELAPLSVNREAPSMLRLLDEHMARGD